MSYSIDEAAKLVGVSTKTLRRWEASGRYKVERSEGGHRQFNEHDILLLKALVKTAQPGGSGGAPMVKTDAGQATKLGAQAPVIMPAATETSYETYTIGYGTYRKVKPSEAVAYLADAKRRAFAHGVPPPTANQLAFRQRLMAGMGKRRANP